MFIKCTIRNLKIIVGTIYRPPSGNCDTFFNQLEYIFSCLPIYDECLIVGDFNINLMNSDSNVTKEFLSIMNSSSFIPVITKPTRLTENSSTLIDNLFLTKPDMIFAGNLISSLSDHLPNFMIHRDLIPVATQNNSSFSYSYGLVNDVTLSHFYVRVSEHNFSSMYNSDNIDAAVQNLGNVLLNYFNTCCPIKTRTLSYKRKMKPWITNDIVGFIRTRQKYYMLYLQGRMRRETFSRFRNFVTLKIRAAKKSYYELKFQECRGDLKKTWELINKTIKPGHIIKRDNISKLIIDDVEYSSPSNIAEQLNLNFASVGRKIAESIPISSDYRNWLRGDYCNSFYFRPISSNVVRDILNSFKDKSCSINQIPTSVYKFISNLISPILCSLINRSVFTGRFPECLKTAKVVPLFKSGERTNPKNYRPISVLPFLSKVFERAVHAQLYSYFEKKAILCNNQFGFRRGKSTLQSCAGYLQYVYDALDNDRNVVSIFLDFQKAFDSVDHQILLRKLYHYGIRGFMHCWLGSYLEGRTQFVNVLDQNSSMCNMSYGVPQGSVLGPFLFLVLINDLPNTSDNLSFNLFADDSTISYSFGPHELSNVSDVLNSEIQVVYDWLCANKIKINVDKTKFIVFSYRQRLSLSNIRIGSSTITQTNSTKFLGLYLDENLKFNCHVDHISRKISKSIFVYPYIVYVIECWYAAPNYLVDRIRVLQ